MNKAANEYKVQLEVFEGPLDLLLYLIKKDEVEIYDIPIELITRQYMEYLDLMRMLDLNIAGDFIVMAATLMMIKSRMLLPPEDRSSDEDEEEDDPRWDLVRQLVEYKKFKDAALHLEALEVRREGVFDRDTANVKLEKEKDITLEDVGIFDLIAAFNDALSKVKQEELREIFSERFTVEEKVEYIVTIIRDEPELSFSRLFRGMASRNEIVCTFLAVLELIRLKQIRAKQRDSFGDIVMCRVDDV